MSFLDSVEQIIMDWCTIDQLPFMKPVGLVPSCASECIFKLHMGSYRSSNCKQVKVIFRKCITGTASRVKVDSVHYFDMPEIVV